MRRHELIATMAIGLIATGIYALGPTPADAQDDDADGHDLAALAADVEALKRMLPSQSHTMADVEFHFANLWFAGKNENWPLATFYLNETRSHLNWTVRLRPVRRLANGEIDLRPILEGIESGALADLRAAVDAKDSTRFQGAYRGMMAQCHACHVASEKPFLEPHIPDFPPSPIINSQLRQ